MPLGRIDAEEESDVVERCYALAPDDQSCPQLPLQRRWIASRLQILPAHARGGSYDRGVKPELMAFPCRISHGSVTSSRAPRVRG
jgi:hypothetical protein